MTQNEWIDHQLEEVEAVVLSTFIVIIVVTVIIVVVMLLADHQRKNITEVLQKIFNYHLDMLILIPCLLLVRLLPGKQANRSSIPFFLVC